MLRDGSDRGQAVVELLALLPLLAALGLGAVQGVLAAEGLWMSGVAARAGARAVAAGGDPAVAARAALPGAWSRRIAVIAPASGNVTVRLRVPSVLPAAALGSVESTAGPGAGR